jgi:membrane protein required for colicin V production
MGEFSIAVVDVVIVLVILVSAGYAAYRGLMRETLLVFAWAAAAYATLAFGPYFARALDGSIEAAWLRFPVAYGGMFLVVFVPLSFLSHNWAQSIQRTPIGPVDRTLGFVFGIGRGLVLVAIAYIVFAAVAQGQQDPPWLRRAQFYPLVLNTSDVLLSLVPPDNAALPVMRAFPPPPPAAPRPAPRQASDAEAGKTYGAGERSALDRLIETTGGR